MAVTQQSISFTARPVLNVGLDASGNIKTVNSSFGSTLSPTTFSDGGNSTTLQKLLNIVGALEDCLQFEVYRVTKTHTVSFASE